MKSLAARRFAPPPARTLCLFLAAMGIAALMPPCDAQESKAVRMPTNGLPVMPVAFERYQGQFVARTSAGAVLLEPQQIRIAPRRPEEAKGRQGSLMGGVSSATLSLRLLGSNGSSAGIAEEPLLARANYFIGKDPAGWRTDVPLFGKVRFPSVYKQMDVVYYGNQKELEYDFVVQPGGEPQAIRFSVEGAGRTTIAANGDLKFQSGGTQAILHRPVAYQLIAGERRNIPASFRSLHGNRFGIRVGPYDRESPLIIDPVLGYSSYLGGSDDEGIFGIGFDGEGNVYVAGETSSLNFPEKGGFQDHSGGDYDVFVSKFDPRAARLIYSTYLGGAKYDHAIGIRVDKQGNAYVAGITQSRDFPVKNAWKSALPGIASGFVAKLRPSGSELAFSTYLGGQRFDLISALTVDDAGAIYVAGYTSSLDFPTTPNAFQKQCDGGAHSGFCLGDAFITKFDPSGQALIYSTYLGGAGTDSAAGIAVDQAGTIYAAGQTGSKDFPTRNAYQGSLRGPANGFIAALSETGSALKFSTYLGGTGFDGATDVALDARGNIYVTGTTSSLDFPVVHAFQPTNKGGMSDGFVTKFDPNASQIIYSTFYGGSGWDYPFRIAVNRHEEAALIGFTSSTDFPNHRGLTPGYNGGPTDAFVVQLDRNGQRPLLSTYLGGGGAEYGYAVSTGCRGNIWVGGSTSSIDFPVVRAFQSRYAGGPYDAFLSRIVTSDGEDGGSVVLGRGESRGEWGCPDNGDE